ncbi:hypothetical protein QCA50_016684 [Cerrena zonata]|uniref:Pentatricopeptide repeat-containing protein n=1 Tax=Cerrena zonata TaxID=2478898 RepID=A0AAW0FF15_9APHY
MEARSHRTVRASTGGFSQGLFRSMSLVHVAKLHSPEACELLISMLSTGHILRPPGLAVHKHVECHFGNQRMES